MLEARRFAYTNESSGETLFARVNLIRKSCCDGELIYTSTNSVPRIMLSRFSLTQADKSSGLLLSTC